MRSVQNHLFDPQVVEFKAKKIRTFFFLELILDCNGRQATCAKILSSSSQTFAR
jgi:hypothetical protein